MAAHPQDINTLQWLIFPGIVAVVAAFMSFLGSFVISYRNSSSEKKSKRTNILDNLSADFSSLSQLVDKLKVDGEEKTYFALKNVIAGQTVLTHLRKLIEDIVVFSDTSLRREIIEVVEDSSALFTDLSGLETYVLQRGNENKLAEKEYKKELRSLRTKFMRLNIIVEANLIVTSPLLATMTNQNNKNLLLKKIDEAVITINELVNEKSIENNQYNEFLKGNDKKRMLFNIRLLDVETKIRELSQKLTTGRNKILNQ